MDSKEESLHLTDGNVFWNNFFKIISVAGHFFSRLMRPVGKTLLVAYILHQFTQPI